MMKYFSGRFEDKGALFVGVGQGSTKEAAVRMAAEGADVIITDLNKNTAEKAGAECRAHGRKVLVFEADATKMDQMTAVVGHGLKELRKIDIMVYGAVDVGEVGGPLRTFMETTEEEWERHIASSYKGFLVACKLVLPGMIERKYGKIIGIATDASRQGSTGEALIGGARAGMIGFSKTLAREVARHKINVNIVSPGPHDTPVMRATFADKEAEFGRKVVEAMTKWVAFKRLGTPEEIAAGTCFLASDDANFITGQTLSISGGLSMF